MKNSRQIGLDKEKLAAAYLIDLGYAVLTTNFRSRFGEIDIVAMDNGELVFIEVKYRSSERYGSPFDAVDFHKQKKICRTALAYLMLNHIKDDVPLRFDVIGIYRDGSIHHIKNAFSAGF